MLNRILCSWTLSCVLLMLHALETNGPRLRPIHWAQPVLGTKLDNWHQVDSRLFRSAQPKSRDIAALKAMGIKRILCLRNLHDNDHLKEQGFELIRLRTNAGDIDMDEILKALRIITASKDKILVHCWHGSDRTGCIVACYRIAIQGWSKDQAIDELLHGGYGFHSMFDNIPTLLQKLDEDDLRKKLTANPSLDPQTKQPTQQ